MPAASSPRRAAALSAPAPPSRLAVGTTAGSHTYKIDPFELLHERGGEGTSIVEMHYSTCLVAHVGSGEVRHPLP